MVLLLGKKTLSSLFIVMLVLGLVAGGISYTTTSASKGTQIEQWIRSGQIVKQVKTDKKIVALTFDDGPSATFTPQVLDILKKYNAKATFFVIGHMAEQHPEIIKRTFSEGHELANHTYGHPLSSVKSSKLAEELDKTDEIIHDITGQHTRYFRPPGGKCTRSTVEPALEKGYKVVLWTAVEDPRDWADPGVSKIISRVVKNVRNGSIIIMHDCGGDRTQTVKALPTILSSLKEKGYSFVTISDLLKESTTVPTIEDFKEENWSE